MDDSLNQPHLVPRVTLPCSTLLDPGRGWLMVTGMHWLVATPTRRDPKSLGELQVGA
jgi:hypothetical protein